MNYIALGVALRSMYKTEYSLGVEADEGGTE